MSYPFSDCCATTCCPETEVVNVPGSPGVPGTATNGTNGVSSYTTTTADFVVPAIGATVTVTVGDSRGFSVGQNAFVQGPANFEVVSKPGSGSMVLEFLGYTGDVSPGANIASGAQVSVGGLQGAAPANTFANGMTTGTTKATAQTNLGLGQDAIISSGNALTQDITASLVQVGSIDVTIPVAGTYELEAWVSTEMAGATFASSRVVTIEIRNVTQNVTLVTTTRNTGVQTTITYPSIDYYLPFAQSATLAASDHIQIRIMVAVVPSAGTYKVVAGSLIAIPLRKT